MSTYYDLYTEIKVNGKWNCINNKLLNVRNNAIRLTQTYWSGSRSFFGDAADEIERRGYYLREDELSEEILAEHPYLLEPHEGYPGYALHGIDWKELCAAIPNDKDKEHHAFVLKDTVFAFEHDETDEIWDYLDGKEYHRLSDEEKKTYTYYEWNSSSGWYHSFLEIKEHVKWQLYEWQNANCIYGDEPEDVRIVMIVS